jgi:pimeloyl-ACP methyl ester carboxylesterase
MMSNEGVSRRDVLGLAAASMAAEPRLAGASAASIAVTGAAAAAAGGPAPSVSIAPVMVDRAFLRLQEGLVHYRHAGRERLGQRGAPLPLYFAHAGPGSGRVYEPYLQAFGASRFAFAPDMLGNGDSAPPAGEDLEIGYYVDCALRLADSLGIERFDFYGSHTGAQIGCQLAVEHPRRIRRLILDGVPLFPADLKQQMLENYAPKVVPDDYGTHLVWAWNFVRDQQLYFPWFDRSSARRLSNPVSPAAQIHASVTDVIKALRTYHIAYHAAFRQDLHALLPKLTCPVFLTTSQRDPLTAWFDDAIKLAPAGSPHAVFTAATTMAERIGAISGFLDA